MADPASELDNLLSGHARIEPYQSADAPDAARLLFGGLPEGDEALAALDRAVWEWLDSQRTGGVPDLDQLPLERWLRKVSEAFEIIALLKLRHTALDLRQRFVVWNSWCDRLAISAQRDGRYAFLRTLALTQRIVADADSAVTPFGLEPLWLQVCEYAGGAYPKHYLAVSLLGLRMLPEREGTPSERPWMTGLVHWTIGQKPTAEEFSQQWWALKGLYPRMPSYWRSALTGTLRQSSVNQISDELKKWWQQDVARKEGPIAEESEIQSVGVPQLPSRKTHQSLLNRKTVRFNKSGLEKLPENKPVVYKIVTKGGANNYTGIAKRGRVQERLSEHLPGGPDAIPGAKVVIEQVDNLPTAKKKEANTIKRARPKYNKQGK